MADVLADPKVREAVKPLRSLRVKVLLVVAAVAVAPQLLVLLWSLMERNIAGDMEVRVAFVADEVATRLDVARDGRGAGVDVVRELAGVHGVRVRVLEPGGGILDEDADQGTDLVHQIGTLFFGPDGAPTLAEMDRALPPLDARPEVREARRSGRAVGCRTSEGGKLLVCHAVRASGSAEGERVIYVQESSRRAVRALYDLRYHLARLSLVTVPFALLLAAWMGKRIVGPVSALRVEALRRAAALQTTGALAAPHGPMLVRGDDEVSDLARAFDALLTRLEERQGENARFVADLVHELKNPVAAVRAAAEALGAGPVDGARARRLERILADSSARLDAVVSQFLELARAEGGLAGEARVPVDLGALASGIAEAMRARHEGVTFDVAADEGAEVLGVPHGLDTTVRNLVENAASFALPRAGAPPRVAVAVRTLPGEVVLTVSDTGPGIPEKDLGRVFERFFTTRRQAQGTGLGLALVEATVLAHGGRIAASSEEGEGAVFTVRLPRAVSHRVHTARDDLSPHVRS